MFNTVCVAHTVTKKMAESGSSASAQQCAVLMIICRVSCIKGLSHSGLMCMLSD